MQNVTDETRINEYTIPILSTILIMFTVFKKNNAIIQILNIAFTDLKLC